MHVSRKIYVMRGVDFAPARERIYSVQLNDHDGAAFMSTRYDANKLFMMGYLLIRGSSSPVSGFEPNAMAASAGYFAFAVVQWRGICSLAVAWHFAFANVWYLSIAVA
eukprot:4323019-Amphidinium_carterae.1